MSLFSNWLKAMNSNGTEKIEELLSKAANARCNILICNNGTVGKFALPAVLAELYDGKAMSYPGYHKPLKGAMPVEELPDMEFATMASSNAGVLLFAGVNKTSHVASILDIANEAPVPVVFSYGTDNPNILYERASYQAGRAESIEESKKIWDYAWDVVMTVNTVEKGDKQAARISKVSVVIPIQGEHELAQYVYNDQTDSYDSLSDVCD